MRFGEHEYPDSVLTKDRKGNPEIRNLLSRGEFILHDYRDPVTFGNVESNKQKLYLKALDGTITELFIIPTKSPERALMIRPKEKEEKNRMIWNEKTQEQEELWKTD